MGRLVLIFAAVVMLAPVKADALTVRDIVELSRAGLGDEVLLALIEVDRSVFPIDTPTLKLLKAAGVSDQVILAMVRSARTPVADDAGPALLPPVSAAAEPQVIVIEHHDAPPQIREVPVAVPVYIPVVRRSHDRDRDGRDGDGDDSRGPGTRTGEHSRRHEPVYWGWGGTLRPDAWKPK